MKLLRELVGTAGYCLLCGGLYVHFGAGVAMMIGGGLLIVAAWLARPEVRA